jgi:hypothetical protein
MVRTADAVLSEAEGLTRIIIHHEGHEGKKLITIENREAHFISSVYV